MTDDTSTRARARAIFDGKLVLAPMTKGSNIPFRRLCRELGADVTVGEMAIARKVAQRRRPELALLRSHPDDHPFGAQLADRDADTLAVAAAKAEEMGSDFVDLNCGCPIDHFTRRGLGAALLRRPNRFKELIAAMRKAVSIPLTVKIRLGWSEEKKNYRELARIAQEEGADAIAMHARTRSQRYSRAADWERIRELVEDLEIPVIGNGDVLAHWEAEARWKETGCAALMSARGALIKPWIFREIREGRTIHLDAQQRLALLRRYVELSKEHFGDDEYGVRHTRKFLTWHLEFLCRYRHLPRDEYESASFEHPLLQSRLDTEPFGDGLEHLMTRTDPAAHEHLVAIALGEIDEDAPPPPMPTRDGRGDAVMSVSNG